VLYRSGMAQTIFHEIIHASGESAPAVRFWPLGGSTIRVSARSDPGLSPPAAPPTVLVEWTGDGGETWAPLVDLGPVAREVVAATAQVSEGAADLRVRWYLAPPPAAGSWTLRVWLD
jgi:hypothetical protein